MASVKEFSKDVQKALKGKGVKVQYLNQEDKYSKERYAFVFKGYDFLEDLFTVRTFIQKKYDIKFNDLELLLKLMGMKIFTRKMYSNVPKFFTHSRLSYFIDRGFVNLIMDDHCADNKVFTLSLKGRAIVTKFYAYLSGEEKIPLNSKHNPMVKSETSFDKKKLEVIKGLQGLDVPEHKKYLF